MATRKKKIEISEISDLPNIVKGTHLTVITYKDGRTELQWDDEALLSEVRNAILKHNSTIPVTEKKPNVKAKSNKKVPEAMKRKTETTTKKTVKKTKA